MNTKDKDYKEWLSKTTYLSKVEWSFPCSKEYDDAWFEVHENPKYLKFNRYDNPPKWYINFFNREDRYHNKQALKKNLKMMGSDYDEYDEFIELRYNHRNKGKWLYW